jgi:hypothetical protein
VRRGRWLTSVGVMAQCTRRFRVAVGLLLVLYVGSYVVRSRRAYAEAERCDMKGFYYFTPENSDRWRFWNYTCVYLYLPLNAVDRWIGLGRGPACEPLWGLDAQPALGPW